MHMGKRTAPPARNETILAKVRLNPETATIEFAGEEYLFLLSGLGLKLARAGGHDPIPAIFGIFAKVLPVFTGSGMFEADGQIDADRFSLPDMLAAITGKLDGQLVEDLAVVIWWGLLTAQPDVTLEDVELGLTPRTLVSVVQQVWPKMVSYQEDNLVEDTDDQGGSDSGGEGTEGN